MACTFCGRGLTGYCDCEPEEDSPPVALESTSTQRKLKEDDKITVSAGRKRAAAMYPIDPNDWCEWRGYKNCGGGLHPVVGCINGRQQHRQHGPVKATYCNDEGNVHRICARCHNRWHTLNDPVYNESIYSALPHSPIVATEEELIANFYYWKAGGTRLNSGVEVINNVNVDTGNETDSISPG